MALKFNDATGGNSGPKVDTYEYKNGENRFRIFGDILPRYLFWIPNPKGTPKELPVEALQFQREKENWDNSLKEPVKEFYPDLKPKWSYCALCLDEDDNVKVVFFKKTLWSQIKDTAESLGDPTSEEDGWTVVFKKKKTGPNPMNVEYNLDALKSQATKGALTEEQKQAIADAPKIEEVYPRPTEEQVHSNINNIMSSGEDEEVDTEATEELNIE